MMKCLLCHFSNAIRKAFSFLMETMMMNLALNVHVKKLLRPEIKQKLDQVYYHFNYADLNVEIQ